MGSQVGVRFGQTIADSHVFLCLTIRDAGLLVATVAFCALYAAVDPFDVRPSIHSQQHEDTARPVPLQNGARK